MGNLYLLLNFAVNLNCTKLQSIFLKMQVSTLKSRLIVINFGGLWHLFDGLMKAMDLFPQGPSKPMFRPSGPDSQFISEEIIRGLSTI